MDAARIGDQHLLGKVCLARQHHELAAHRIVDRLVRKDRGQCAPDRLTARLARIVVQPAARRRDDMRDKQFLHRLVAREAVIVFRRKENQILMRQ